MVKCLPEFEYFTVLLKNRNFISKIKRSKVTDSEFSETPNQAYFYANFWFCTRTFPAGDSNLRHFFSADASQTP